MTQSTAALLMEQLESVLADVEALRLHITEERSRVSLSHWHKTSGNPLHL
jgi:hypothetical protein